MRRGRTCSRRGSPRSLPILGSVPGKATAGRGDWILCQVTSNPYGDPHAIHLTDASFAAGSLRADSYARPGKLFTASRDLMVAQVAVLSTAAFQQVVDAVVVVVRGRSRD